MTFAARPLWFLGSNPDATVLVGAVFGAGQTGTAEVQAGSIQFSPTGVAGTGAVGSIVSGFTSYTNPIGFDGGAFSALNYSNGAAIVQLVVNTNGTWTITLSGWDAEGPYTGNWGNPTTVGAGDALYYRYILNSALPSGGAGESSWTPGSISAPYTSTWIGGGGGNIINLIVNSTNIGSGSASVDVSYTIQISTTAGTAGLVAQGTVTLSTSSLNNPPP